MAEGLCKTIACLESISDRLELIPETGPELMQPVSRITTGRKVFVVHGHDEAAKDSVARFLERLDLEPIILHERPNEN